MKLSTLTTRFALCASTVLLPLALAQTSKYCPSRDKTVCYSVNIPDQTASQKSGDIYFQIQGPSTLQWIGLGQGGQMAGSNIFIIYADSTGNNVTLSPRLGKGNVEPDFDKDAQVALLDGTGIEGGMMTANVRCSNCAKWTGGSMDLTSSSSEWIWAVKNGSPIKSNDQSADLKQHSDMDDFKLDLTKARGGSSLNPFAASSSSSSNHSSTATSSGVTSSTSTSSSSSDSSGGSSGGSSDSADSNVDMAKLMRITTTHGAVMGLAFVFFYPLGAMIIRLASFKGLIWVHAGIQAFAFTLAIVGLGLGVYIGVTPDYQINTYHPVIGLVVLALLLFQPPLGYMHHVIYMREGHRSIYSAAHIWLGRIVITLGIINGGLGLRLAQETKGKEIAYGVVAGIVWVVWMAVAVFGEVKRGKGKGAPTQANGAEKGNGSANGSGSG